MARVLLVDDHPVVREGLATILRSEHDIDVVAEADSIEDAVELVSSASPDVAVLDYRLPGMSGVDGCAHLLSRTAGLRVVVLTSFPNESVMLKAFAAGARGFVAKGSAPHVLRTAVRSVAAGGTFVDPSLAGTLVAAAIKGRRAVGPFGLSRTELRVLELLGDGQPNQAIARELDVSVPTVKTHVQHVLRKLGATDRYAAVAVARREGLLG
jgi:DNA-binding NarL/FixJ family response regulator